MAPIGSGRITTAKTSRLAPQFPPEKAQAWLRHNVEEVGCFVDFLPTVYADAMNASAEPSGS